MQVSSENSHTSSLFEFQEFKSEFLQIGYTAPIETSNSLTVTLPNEVSAWY